MKDTKKSSKSILGALALVLVAVLVAGTLILAHGSTCHGSEKTRINDLIENAKEYDGRNVMVEGEVVGDKLQRGEYVLITVNDDPYSKQSIPSGSKPKGVGNIGIGVWVPNNKAKEISVPGSYERQGQYVRIEGVFNRACAEHGGDMDIHAENVEILKSAHLIRHHIQFWKLLIVLVLSSITIALLLAVRRPAKKIE